MNLSVHQLMYVLQTSDLFVFFSTLGLSLDFKSILFLKDEINLDSSSLLGERLFVHPDLLFEFLVLHLKLLTGVHRLRHDRKGRLRLITALESQFFKLSLHSLDGLDEFFFLSDLCHNEGERIVKPKLPEEYFFSLSERIM